jgi:CPA2 family monovalent cation:H+ antiporter-2
VGVLIVEDLIAILLMAVLTALSRGEGMSAGHAAQLQRPARRRSSSR